MPTYEFKCAKCEEEFTRFMSLKERDTGQVACPKCGSLEVQQQISKVLTILAAKHLG
ncbi:MAG: zinc ribbon domain-containing protein [Desulfobaccales bacterium]